jgi:ABC-2 family transporter protein
VIWLTWRQHRAQALATLIGIGAIGVFLLITGPRIASAFHELQACLAVPGQDCSLLHESFDQRFNGLSFLIPVFMVVPMLMGVFLGAPLIAREVEQGTHRLAWTQSVTRGRWAVTKIGLVSAFTVAAAGLFAWMVTTWSSPLVAASDDRFGFGVFDLRGIVPIAYALFALALGTAIGALIRKPLPAMAITLGAFVAVRAVVELVLRPRYLPAQTVSYPFLSDGPRAGLGDWVITSRVLDPTGSFVSPDGGISVNPSALAHACPGISGTFPGKDDVGRCLTRLGVSIVDTYQPGSRYWLFQGIESAIFLLLAAALVVLAMWLIRRRIS